MLYFSFGAVPSSLHGVRKIFFCSLHRKLAEQNGPGLYRYLNPFFFPRFFLLTHRYIRLFYKKHRLIKHRLMRGFQIRSRYRKGPPLTTNRRYGILSFFILPAYNLYLPIVTGAMIHYFCHGSGHKFVFSHFFTPIYIVQYLRIHPHTFTSAKETETYVFQKKDFLINKLI